MIGDPIIGRVLVCGRCHASVDVIEAATGATTLEEHQHLDAESYVCGECLDPEALTPTQASEALGRARNAQEAAREEVVIPLLPEETDVPI